MRAVEPSRARARLTRPGLTLLATLALALATACSNNDSTTPASPTTTGPATETLDGTLAPKGIAIRTFNARQAGTVTVLLAKTDPPATLGLGIGIRGTTGSDCRFSQTVNTPAGATAQLSVAVDAGVYCAGAYDIGTVGQGGVTVTVTISHP